MLRALDDCGGAAGDRADTCDPGPGRRRRTAAEPAATTDLLLPAGLPEPIATLLADGPPDRTVVVDG
ncbi:hypothetical protein ACFWNT_08760 [Streptomyces sp. NPDC058409]|uniref:hypothetical protein n=1 Tax=Streptomyces sp. NPDC058409 TaxID=3346484 RepID=UPI003658C1BB